MTAQHHALIVEDDAGTAEDLSEILTSLGCTSTVTDNVTNALELLGATKFCFVLLDLQIRHDRRSIKGHTEHGIALLRKIRRTNTEHAGLCYWMPIMIVSGFAREFDVAVSAMKDGADDILQKPLKIRGVSEKLLALLERAGRVTHDSCLRGRLPGGDAAMRAAAGDDRIVLAISGERERRRTQVSVNSRVVEIPDASLKVLLRLMIGHLAKEQVHKREIGATDDPSYKGVSRLHEALRTKVVKNEYHGFYRLADGVVIGPCDIAKLESIGDAAITDLARKLGTLLVAAHKESDGNF